MRRNGRCLLPSHTVQWVGKQSLPRVEHGPAFRSAQQLRVEELLGEGRLSSVMLCTCLRSGVRLALKVYHKQGMTIQNCKQVCIFHIRFQLKTPG